MGSIVTFNLYRLVLSDLPYGQKTAEISRRSRPEKGSANRSVTGVSPQTSREAEGVVISRGIGCDLSVLVGGVQ